MSSKARRKQLRSLGLEMRSGLHGITLSWSEVGTALSATEQAIKNTPRGMFVTQFLERLNRKLKKRRALNLVAIENGENERARKLLRAEEAAKAKAEKPCDAEIWHGNGHQTRSKCSRLGKHKQHAFGDYFWTKKKGFSGFLNESPQDER